ncbi:MAG TPA: hypothetical protein P5218_16460 [Planctomycetota bacterium]|nr:hypothetical protein [Planctomycetota bacterium]
MRKEHGEGAFLIAQIFSIVSERADLRSWLTLPSTWQAARLYPRPGPVDLVVAAQGGETVHLGTYELEPGETLFVLVRTIGPRTYAQVIGGRSVTEPAAQVPVESENPTPSIP